MVLVTLVIGALIGQSALGDPASKIAQKQSELDRIQSAEGPLSSQIDQMNAEVDRLIGEESRLRQEQDAAEHELRAEAGRARQGDGRSSTPRRPSWLACGRSCSRPSRRSSSCS